MAEETVKDASQGAASGQVKEAPSAVGRFRLPKLFAEQAEAGPPTGEAGAAGSGEEGAVDAGLNGSASSGAASMMSSNANGVAAGGSALNGTGGSFGSGSSAANATSASTSNASSPTLMSAGSGSLPPTVNPQSPAALMLNEIAQLHEGMELIYRSICDMSERESSREKVFDTLYTELREYKNDFIYEHMKPVVRPLLFLYDSLEQFDREVQEMILPPEAERRQLSPTSVRQNMGYFMDQLTEALRICEVVQMEPPEGAFNPKLHKAVGVEEVGPERDNTVVRVVRSGWYLNGQLLRPAEVVVGRVKNVETKPEAPKADAPPAEPSQAEGKA